MRYLLNKTTDTYFNLALDEYVMKNLDVGEDYFILWQNQPSVIIGKNQNTVEEVDVAFAEENGITIARRVTGGGAVYQDFGNLNFTIITNVDDISKVDFKKYVLPVVEALATLGIKAEASGRNDILIDGKKISGNAQRQAKGRLMHHGTLMFDVNIEDMVAVLNASPDKFISKAAKSVRSRVTNIKDHLPVGTTLEDFWSQLHNELSNQGKDTEIVLTPEQIAEVEEIATTQYATWDWIYGKSPEFTYTNRQRFPGGTVEPFIAVEEGQIRAIRLQGDYLGLNDVIAVEEALIGVRYQQEDVAAILDTFILPSYFGTITKEELLSILF